MKELLEKNNLFKLAKINEIVEGKIVSKGRSSVFLDLGSLGTGIVYGREFLNAKETLKNLKVGESLFVKIVDLENDEGYVELSLSQAGAELAWEKLRQQKEENEIITVKISKANKGGLLAELSGIQAFLPVSQLNPEPYPRVEGADTNNILKELQKFIGQQLAVKIFDVDPKTEKLILSEKAIESEKVKEILKKYNVGDVLEGEITGITDFGAFIKFGEEKLEGLIHISELDWKLIQDPSEVVQIGQVVQVKIVEISDGRVSLSLKALKQDPWAGIEEKFKKGDIVKGAVTKLNPFGAFVQLTPGIQGLCHISEIGTQKKMQDVLEMGKSYNFEILIIEPKEHKMSLRLASEVV